MEMKAKRIHENENVFTFEGNVSSHRSLTAFKEFCNVSLRDIVFNCTACLTVIISE